MERANKEMPLYLQIAEWIRNDIKCGVIQPGEKLASEHDMMKKYGVSRMTVRNAFSELVNEGLQNKLYRMPDEARAKLQETLERIINEGCSGLICLIL